MSEFWTVAILMISALILTILIECGIVHLIKRDKSLTYWVLLCNLATNPALNFIMLCLFQIMASVNVAILLSLEICVVFVEALMITYISKTPLKTTLKLSLLLNSISFIVGCIVSTAIA
ncbi:MAG: hypothetical protein R3Y32_08435 [Bacillota bacterium]